MTAIANGLKRLRSGEITFDQFARETRGEWQALAKYIVSKWSPPPAVELDDLEQELLVACWQAVDRWDDKRGVPIKRYCVFQSVDRAKRWLHVQRAAGRGKDRAPSRAPVPFSSLDADVIEAAIGAVDAPQELLFLREEAAIAALGRCNSARDRSCVRAMLEHGSLEVAVAHLYDNEAARVQCQFEKREDIRRAIRRAVQRVAA